VCLNAFRTLYYFAVLEFKPRALHMLLKYGPLRYIPNPWRGGVGVGVWVWVCLPWLALNCELRPVILLISAS
jgi:hypothetical protein